jgi:hypothetical protein
MTERLRRVSIIATLLVAAFAFIAAQCDSNAKPPSSGIEGLVTIGPVCPVERIDTPCPDKPYQATLVVTDGQGGEVARVQSSTDGRFRVALAAGAYTLAPQSSSQGSFPIAKEQQVEVRAGEYTTVSVQFDSGIR